MFTDSVPITPVPSIAPNAPQFGGTKPRLMVYSRNGVSYLSCRSWVRETKKADLAALKAAKSTNDPATLEMAAEELAELLRALTGASDGTVVTCIPCGHSRRPDCFGYALAMMVAAKLNLPFEQMFEHRFVSGVSHPKEFDKLPALEPIASPDERLVIVVDDIATSGWRMEEILTHLRDREYTAIGAVWLAGNVLD